MLKFIMTTAGNQASTGKTQGSTEGRCEACRAAGVSSRAWRWRKAHFQWLWPQCTPPLDFLTSFTQELLPVLAMARTTSIYVALTVGLPKALSARP